MNNQDEEEGVRDDMDSEKKSKIFRESDLSTSQISSSSIYPHQP